MKKNPISRDLQAYLESVKALAKRGSIGPDRLTICAEYMTPADIIDAVQWLREQNGKLSDDVESYVSNGFTERDTCHVWIESTEVQMACGFQYKGEKPAYMTIALDSFNGI